MPRIHVTARADGQIAESSHDLHQPAAATPKRAPTKSQQCLCGATLPSKFDLQQHQRTCEALRR